MSRYRASSRKPYYKENKDEKMLSIFVMLYVLFKVNKYFSASNHKRNYIKIIRK